ncbi:MAG: PIN domain-containing protein [Candidatus Diapherotrites archaeon]
MFKSFQPPKTSVRQKFYVDTSVWRDYFEDRSDGLRPLGEFAFRFLKWCQSQHCAILVSDAVELELRIFASGEKVRLIFQEFEESIVHVVATTAEVEEARTFWEKNRKRFPLADILHSIVARDNDAVLVSRDNHFKEIEIVQSFKPEEINPEDDGF